jgi:hypothetical protein
MKLGLYGMRPVVVFGLLASTFGSSSRAQNADATRFHSPVLLELFTSEGCSSCPPADKLLEKLDRTQPLAGAQIIVLSEHVDYWNSLGWTDPFSSSLFSQRQMEYVNKLGLSGAYTPQLVIDGFKDAVGSDESAVLAAILQAEMQTKVPVDLKVQRSGTDLSVDIKITAGGRGTNVYVALADDHAQSQVTRGENSHRTLQHVAVVKTLQLAGCTNDTGAFDKDLNLQLKDSSSGTWRLVVFLQNAASNILGVAQARI